MFTGAGSEEAASEAISAGATDYIRKEHGTEQSQLLANRITNAVTQSRGKKRASKAEQRLRDLSETTNDILWMVVADWSEFLFVNSSYEEIWGRSRDTLLDDSIDFMKGVHPDDRELAFEMMDRVSDGDEVDFELRVNAEEDFSRWVWIQAHLIQEDPYRDRVAGYVRDITERKARVQKLEEQNERLDRFASIVSHDLRNPLNVAHGRSELLGREYDSNHVDALQTALTRMETIIDDMLHLARAGQDIETPEQCSLEEATESAWETVETGESTLDEQDTDMYIEADPTRLIQLFENLFRNAIEHNEPPVAIGVGSLASDDGFYIEDDGAGIPADEREDVFEHGYTTSDGGSGFGLAIVSDIVSAHGWSITVTDSPSDGVRFEVRTA